MKTYRYYQGQKLSTIGSTNQMSAVLHCSFAPLAEQRVGASDNTVLIATDTASSVVHAEGASTYAPYGHFDFSRHGSVLGFNGQARDPVTHCDLLGNGRRVFNPVLMRFNSPDNFSPFDLGGINAYAYCGGDPINYADPTGNMRRSQTTPLPPKKRQRVADTSESAAPLPPQKRQRVADTNESAPQSPKTSVAAQLTPNSKSVDTQNSGGSAQQSSSGSPATNPLWPTLKKLEKKDLDKARAIVDFGQSRGYALHTDNEHFIPLVAHVLHNVPGGGLFLNSDVFLDSLEPGYGPFSNSAHIAARDLVDYYYTVRGKP